MKVAKYKLAAFFAHHLGGQEMPPAPFDSKEDHPGILLGGRAYKWLRLSLRTWDEQRAASFLATILYSKKGMPRPTEKMVKEACLQSVEFLTTFNPTGMRTIDTYKKDEFISLFTMSEIHQKGYAHENIQDHTSLASLTLADFRQQIERTVDEIFPPSERDEILEFHNPNKKRELFDHDLLTAPRFPSTSANYNRGRNKGGAVGEVMRVRDLIGLRHSKHDNVTLVTGNWQAGTDTGAGFKRRKFVSEYNYRPPKTVMRTLYGHVDEDEREELVLQNSKSTYHVNPRNLDSWARELYTEVYELAATDPPLVEPVGLAEALKVRVISKGPPLLYTALKPVQQFMWERLKKNRAFALIGEPITEGYILERMGREIEDDEAYNSGDYKSSTDYLSQLISTWIANRFSSNVELDSTVRGMLLRSLLRHTFIAPKPKKGEKPLFEGLRQQKWGQLMGSVTSFPFLCIANAAITRWSLEYGKTRTYTLEQSRMAINGDDVVARMSPFQLDVWGRLGKAIGLVPSVGKCYYSRRYLNMNSTSFMRDIDENGEWKNHTTICAFEDRKTREFIVGKTVEREGPFSLIKYVNMGLLLGKSRSTAMVNAVGNERDKPIGTRAVELLKCAPSDLRQKVYKTFLNKHWDVLSGTRVPWFMPDWIGGLGLPTLFKDEKEELLIQSELHPLHAGASVFDDDGNLVDRTMRAYKEHVSVLEPFGPTQKDLQIARNIVLNFHQKTPMKNVAAPSWKLHQYVMQHLPRSPIATTEEVDTTGYDRLYALLTVEALFTQGITQILDKSPAEKNVRVLRHNERIWSKTKPLSKPMPLFDILEPRKYFKYLPVSFSNI
jgi:hypothetical protein